MHVLGKYLSYTYMHIWLPNYLLVNCPCNETKKVFN